jgi:Predicted membrane protein
MKEMPSSLYALLKAPSDNIFIQMFRYMLVGGTAFCVDFLLLFLCTDVLGLHYLISAGIGFICGMVVNYILSVHWVFNQRRFNNRVSELFIFMVIGGIGLVLTSLLMWVFTDKVHLHYLLSKIITTVIVLFWNFGARKAILFSRN